MAEVREVITSRHNPLCAHFRRLASSRAYREETGEFLCDSPKLLREAELWGGKIYTMLYTKNTELYSFLEDMGDGKIRKVWVTESVMRSVSPMETPQGVVFSCRWSPSELRPPERLKPGRYLVLEGVQDPGNVGTILRTADAFDCDAVFLLSGCADLYNPKTVRAGMGVHFRLVANRRIFQCGLAELVLLLDRAEIPLYGTALRDDTVDIRWMDLKNCAVVIGSEGRGVSPEILDLCERTIKIPMSPRCESLNAAVAAAVALWEMTRND